MSHVELWEHHVVHDATIDWKLFWKSPGSCNLWLRFSLTFTQLWKRRVLIFILIYLFFMTLIQGNVKGGRSNYSLIHCWYLVPIFKMEWTRFYLHKPILTWNSVIGIHEVLGQGKIHSTNEILEEVSSILVQEHRYDAFICRNKGKGKHVCIQH